MCVLPLLPLDRHSGASAEVQKEEEKKFKEVGEAFTILSDPKKKTRYDSGQDLDEEGMNMGGELFGTPGMKLMPVKY
jgi:DnaJ-class molecular chaperone